MLSEPMTLYKLMNLYMLKQVNFPLTNAQLSGFFLDREYTTYFTLQRALNELLEAGLIKMQTPQQHPIRDYQGRRRDARILRQEDFSRHR